MGTNKGDRNPATVSHNSSDDRIQLQIYYPMNGNLMMIEGSSGDTTTNQNGTPYWVPE
jgi:hypothetical protein